ncbi:unannotated protein [freshwater metagenome]|uniref:Unannotated protein n=1 Tax=freshwater metagenome TaxID=449393 RepID=A0A6J7L0V3_9ZZZZ
MGDDTNNWQAPEVTPLTEADGSPSNPEARIRNGVVASVS